MTLMHVCFPLSLQNAEELRFECGIHLRRAVNHKGEVLESFLTKTCDEDAALAFMNKSLKRNRSLEAVVTDSLRFYGATKDVLGNRANQKIGRWANDRAETPYRGSSTC